MSAFVACVLMVTIAILVYPFIIFREPDFEIVKCPFCFGEDMCTQPIRTLRFESFADVINHLFSVKNVYFTTNNMVLKKLAHSEELHKLDEYICKQHGHIENCNFSDIFTSATAIDYKSLLKTSLSSNHNGYRFCGQHAVEVFLNRTLKITDTSNNLINQWTMSLINVEPLILKAFSQSNFALPKYYGACGRLIVVENCGVNLNSFEHADWKVRAVLARGIINAALELTTGDNDFHIYLTDVSPDNIAVNETTLKVFFVDVGNVILVRKSNNSLVHESVDYIGDDFVYSENAICESSISDHNIYSICKLILSAKAPWPMMKSGLLHSTPEDIKLKFPNLRHIIESCVQPLHQHNRFELIYKLDFVLKIILSIHPANYSTSST